MGNSEGKVSLIFKAKLTGKFIEPKLLNDVTDAKPAIYKIDVL